MSHKYKPKKYMKRCDNPSCPNKNTIFERRSMYHEDGLDFCTLSCLGDYGRCDDHDKNRIYGFSSERNY